MNFENDNKSLVDIIFNNPKIKKYILEKENKIKIEEIIIPLSLSNNTAKHIH